VTFPWISRAFTAGRPITESMFILEKPIPGFAETTDQLGQRFRLGP